jgi:hypothetical protein
MPTNPLKIGHGITENTTFVSAVPKITRTGEEMIIVSLEKNLWERSGGGIGWSKVWEPVWATLRTRLRIIGTGSSVLIFRILYLCHWPRQQLLFLKVGQLTF